MYRYIIVFLMIAPISVRADWYVSAGLGMDLDIVRDGQYVHGALEGRTKRGALAETKISDENPHARFALGFRTRGWDLESYVRYKYRNDWNLRPVTDNQKTHVFNDVESSTVGVSAIRRFGGTRDWQWLAGVGLGATRIVNDSTYVDRADPELGLLEKKTQARSTRTNLTWEAIFGFTRETRSGWSMRIAYRYVNYGEVEAGPYPMRAARFTGVQESHSFETVFMRKLRSK